MCRNYGRPRPAILGSFFGAPKPCSFRPEPGPDQGPGDDQWTLVCDVGFLRREQGGWNIPRDTRRTSSRGSKAHDRHPAPFRPVLGHAGGAATNCRHGSSPLKETTTASGSANICGPGERFWKVRRVRFAVPQELRRGPALVTIMFMVLVAGFFGRAWPFWSLSFCF
jgi:hypothetical protein